VGKEKRRGLKVRVGEGRGNMDGMRRRWEFSFERN
jgi:hypothetical protein